MEQIHEIILTAFEGNKLPRMEMSWQQAALKKNCQPGKKYALCYSWQGETPVLALYEVKPPLLCYPDGRFIIAFSLPAKINGREVNSEWALDALDERITARYYEMEEIRHFYGHTDDAWPERHFEWGWMDKQQKSVQAEVRFA